MVEFLLQKNTPASDIQERGEKLTVTSLLCQYRRVPAPPAQYELIWVDQELNGFFKGCKSPIASNGIFAANAIHSPKAKQRNCCRVPVAQSALGCTMSGREEC
jgi:hypothetical protein